ncbi:restriction endonuclease subunit S [Amycolatopsis dendrobii]|uniref:Restriction endonuclease subunit S n=1 Tax=Amycolatopsis dendrobii TaxID=2760662 RepID=A0A7W3VSQ0_9PSEU|nr:restriction endonuclease subunit S [Amycolatopsis dendrobii]MBB1152508.1 restriction endonuclease subunit S [Amycolatopsis dendrobii]
MGQHDEDNLPAGWILTEVGAVGDVRLGRQRSPDKHTGRYSTKYVRAANITPAGLDISDLSEMDFTPDERLVYSLRVGDILLTEASGSSAQVGRAAIWQGQVPNCCYQNTVIRFRPRAVLPEYALIVFQHYAASGVFARTARGVGIQHLGAKRLAMLDFRLPPLAEQRRIVKEAARRLEELTSARKLLEDTLELTREQNEQIIAAAVAGELVEHEYEIAKRENREFESADMLMSQISDDLGSSQLTFAEGTDDSQERGVEPEAVASVPPGWTAVEIGQTGQVLLGKARNPRESGGPNLRPYLRVANVQENRIDTSDVFEMPFSPTEYKRFALRDGDVLLNEGQSPELVGRPAIYRDEVPGCCFQNSLIRFRPHWLVLSEYALLVFRHYLHSGVFRASSRWTTNIAHLSVKRFAAIPMPVPPHAEQRRIVDDAARRLENSAAQEQGIRTALDSLSGMEAELFASATAGLLADQDPKDESADVLLAKHAGDSPIDPSEFSTVDLSESSELMAQVDDNEQRSIERATRGMHRRGRLADVLHEAGGSLELRELLRKAGFEPDSTQDVEEFYVALRAELDVTLRSVTGRTAENAVLEVLEDATS